MKRASAVLFSCLLLCSLIFAAATTASASGFALYEWGTRSVGMGTTGVATANDPSVLAYNPALMVNLEGAQVMAGVTAIAPSTDIEITKGPAGTGTTSTTDQTFMVPHAFYTQQATDKVWFGVGMFTRFGLGTKYEDDWAGSAMLREILLESQSFTPTVAFKFSEDFSASFGVEVMNGSMYLKKRYPAGAGGDATVDVSGNSVAGHLGLNYKFNDTWNVGFLYRTEMQFSGYGSVQNLANGQDGDAEVKATFPASYTLGVGFKPTEDLVFEASAIYTQWESFDKMSFDYSGVSEVLLPDNDEEFDYKNVWRLQLGGEYKITEAIAARAGYVYDQTPTRHGYSSVMLPANDRNLYSIGLGYDSGSWFADWSGMFITTKERYNVPKTVAGSDYEMNFKNGTTWVSGVSVGYRF